MKLSKKLFSFFIIAFIILTTNDNTYKFNVYAAINSEQNRPYKIAVFLDNSNAMYISFLKENLELIQMQNKDKVEFVFLDAKDNQSVQNEYLDNALNENYDLFIISLVSQNLNDVKDILSKIIAKNIPVILNPDPSQEIINFVKPYKRFVVIGGDYEQSGTMEGQILAKEWFANKETIDKNHDNVLQYIMLKGRTGGSPLVDLRTKYSISALNNAGIKTEEIASTYCEWMQDCAKNSIESLFLKYGGKIEAIISNNDAMAVGAVEALQKYGYNNGNKNMTIPIVGIDGLKPAKDLIDKDFMTGTVIVDPRDLAELLYAVGLNMASGKNPIENTKYKFDDTGFTIHLTYKEYI